MSNPRNDPVRLFVTLAWEDMTPEERECVNHYAEAMIQRDLEGRRIGRTYKRVLLGGTKDGAPIYEQVEV